MTDPVVQPPDPTQGQPQPQPDAPPQAERASDAPAQGELAPSDGSPVASAPSPIAPAADPQPAPAAAPAPAATPTDLAAAALQAAAAPTADSWFYSVNGASAGPVSRQQLQAMLMGGQLSIFAYVWRSGMFQWMPASHVPELHWPGMPPVPGGPVAAYGQYTPPDPAVVEARKNRSAKINCVVLFIMGVIGAICLLVTVLHDRWSYSAGLSGIIFLWFLTCGAAVFAIIYVPLSLRRIGGLPIGFSALGLIGAGALLLEVLGLVLWAAVA